MEAVKKSLKSKFTKSVVTSSRKASDSEQDLSTLYFSPQAKQSFDSNTKEDDTYAAKGELCSSIKYPTFKQEDDTGIFAVTTSL